VGAGGAVAAGAASPAVRRPAPHHLGSQLLRRDRVLARTSTPWRLLPARELGCGSPATCWRRLTEWAKAGVFDALHLEVLDRLGEQGRLDWSRASVDTMSVRARRGGTRWAQIPSIVASLGSKLHVVCDGGGLPLTAAVTAANAGDTIMFQAVLDDVPPIRAPSGRRRTRPGKVHADKAYDSGANRAYLRRRGIRPRIARRGVESPVRLGRHRWRIERALAWLSCFSAFRCGGTATWDGGSRWCCWPVRSSASTGSSRPQRPTRSCVNAPSRGALRPVGTWAATDSARAA
jgi:transposase